MNILYIDDDPTLRKILPKILQDCQVTTAPNGIEGLARLAAESFDLVICDYDMPTLSGVEVWRKLETKYQSRFLLFTGNLGVESPSGFLLRKPASSSEIRNYINHVMDVVQSR